MQKRERKNQVAVIKIIIVLVLALGALVMFFPFFMMVSTSLLSVAQSYQFPPKIIPWPVVWGNYVRLWKLVPFARYVMNSFIVSISITLGWLITCSMGAFSFARLRYPFREYLFVGYIMVMMIPFAVMLIPLSMLVKSMRLGDSLLGVIAPMLFSAYGTFLLRQFFLSIPVEIEESAKLDGCSYFRIYWQIVLPLAKPALATLGLFAFIFSWNSFIWPLVILNSEEKLTVPVALANLQGYWSMDFPLLAAGAVVAIIPTIVLFIAGQRFYVRGISLTGIKG